MPETSAAPSMGAIDEALARMPEIFRNSDFRADLGIHAWPASQMLSMLATLGRIEHAGSIHLWRVRTASVD